MGSILSKGKKADASKNPPATTPVVQVIPDQPATAPEPKIKVEQPTSKTDPMPVTKVDAPKETTKEAVKNAPLEKKIEEPKEAVKPAEPKTEEPKVAEKPKAVVQPISSEQPAEAEKKEELPAPVEKIEATETSETAKVNEVKTESTPDDKPVNRRFLVGGNWKMNGSKAMIDQIVEVLNAGAWNDTVDVFIAPPSTYWSYTRTKAKKEISLGTQNIFYEKSGAYTGEVSVEMMKDLGVEFAIVGHSERRDHFHESDEVVGKKVAFATNNGVQVVVNVGEKLSEREEGKWSDIIATQLKALVDGGVKEWNKVIIAYEPKWAIGTGKVATSSEAQEALSVIRKWLTDNISADVGSAARILYTGSVNPQNCVDLAKCPDCDGFIVGGASLIPGDFISIINSRS